MEMRHFRMGVVEVSMGAAYVKVVEFSMELPWEVIRKFLLLLTEVSTENDGSCLRGSNESFDGSNGKFHGNFHENFGGSFH